MICQTELVELRDVHDELSRRGGRMVAISSDSVEDSRRVVESRGLPFPLLSDTRGDAIRAYGLLHRGGGPGGADIAIPAHALIARDGRILWRFVAHRAQERPAPAEIIDVIHRFIPAE
ncbi:MAG: redoxin domain-containing protein [Phycisphaerae bacterium]|nr:redoxin domain-containing protein [Phycisphaerae bacterium]NUQ47815.1 redoxin domain-containing protein [Phycisphaerae bacterium]